MSAPPLGPIQPVDVLFCCNTAYYQHLAVAIVSLLESNTRYYFRINLMSSDTDPSASRKLTATLRKYNNYELLLHLVDTSGYRDFFVSDHISLEAYLRIFCPKVLDAGLDKVLYLDSDIIVVGDIAGLWNTDLSGKAIGAVLDPYGWARREALGIPADRPYINSGMLLINLRLWRDKRVSDELVAFIRQKGSDLVFHDQDAINAVLWDSISPLPYRWNYQARMCKRYLSYRSKEVDRIRRENPDISIVHFASPDKPWVFGTCIPKKRLYYKYLRKTEWKDYRSFDGRWGKVPRYFYHLLLYCICIDYRSVERLMSRVRRTLRRSGRSGLAQLREPELQ